MNKFQYLFGVKEDQITENCIITPLSPKRILSIFSADKPIKGFLYSTSINKNITILKSHIGALFVGDAVLALQNTPCKRIFFVGACGLVNQTLNLSLGDIILPKEAQSTESFTHILHNKLSTIKSEPDLTLLDKFKNSADLSDKQVVKAISFGSMMMEDNNHDFFLENKIDVIEMECAALFSAAKKIKRSAVALLFISDVLIKDPYYRSKGPDFQNKINQSIDSISKYIDSFINNSK